MSKLDEVKEILNTFKSGNEFDIRYVDNCSGWNNQTIWWEPCRFYILAWRIFYRIFISSYFFIGNQDFSKNKRDQGVIVMLMGLLAIIGIAVLTAALLLFAVYKLSEE